MMTDEEAVAWRSLALAQEKLLSCYRLRAMHRAGTAVDEVSAAKERLRELGVNI